MKPAVFVLFAAMAAAAEVQEPRAGVVLDAAGNAREMLGAAAAMLPGDVLLSGVRALAASSKILICKTDSSVAFNGVVFDAPQGDAVLGLASDGAVAWFSGTRQFARVTESGLEMLPTTVDGEVMAVTLAGSLRVLVKRDDGVHDLSIRIADGATERDARLDVEFSAAVLFPDGTAVFSTESTLTLRTAAGDRTIGAPSAVSAVSMMGDDLVNVRAATGSLALRVSSGTLSALPEVNP